MLVLTRKNAESIVLQCSMEATITVTIIESRGGRVKLGIEADESVDIHRQEIWQQIHESCRVKAGSAR